MSYFVTTIDIDGKMHHMCVISDNKLDAKLTVKAQLPDYAILSILKNA